MFRALTNRNLDILNEIDWVAGRRECSLSLGCVVKWAWIVFVFALNRCRQKQDLRCVIVQRVSVRLFQRVCTEVEFRPVNVDAWHVESFVGPSGWLVFLEQKIKMKVIKGNSLFSSIVLQDARHKALNKEKASQPERYWLSILNPWIQKSDSLCQINNPTPQELHARVWRLRP